MPAGAKKRALWYGALILVAATIAALRLRDGTSNLVDDAYMTLRHSRNVSLGFGLVYNAGEPVLGTTTPLYALAIGALGAVFGIESIPRCAVTVNLLADLAAFFLIVAWVRGLSGSRVIALAAGALYGFAPRAVEYSSGGMEAPVFTLLILLAIHEGARGHDARAGVASGFALFCRPDGGLVGAILLAYFVGTRRRIPWRFILPAAVVLLPWIAYSCATYPTGPIPQSVVAKAHRPWPLGPLYATWCLINQYAAQAEGRTVVLMGIARVLGTTARLTAYVVTALVHVFVMIRGARRLSAPGKPDAWLLLAFAGAYTLLYAVGNPLMLGWYQVPLEAVFAILLLPGFLSLVDNPKRATRGLAAGLVALQIFAALALRDTPLARGLLERWNKARERDYVAVAERIDRVIPKDATVQISENGAFGWAHRGRVLDTAGLQTPGCERYYPLDPKFIVADMAVPAALVLGFRPDVFVSLEIYIRKTCLVDPAFDREYVLDPALSDLSCNHYQSRGLLVFRRRPQTLR